MDNGRDQEDFWHETDNTTPEGYRKEARGQHGGQGSKEMRANDGQGSTVKLVGQSIQARCLVGSSLKDSGDQFCKGEGDFEAIPFFRVELREAVQEGEAVRNERDTTVKGSLAGLVVVTWGPWKMEDEDLLLDISL